MRKEIIGNAELYLGDSRAILRTIEYIDAVVADPPYGVKFKGSVTKHTTDSQNSYLSFEDTPENIESVCVPIVMRCIDIANRVALTPGIKYAHLYPRPDGEGVFWYPSGANTGPWGFITHQPIFYYGKCPYLSAGKGSRPTGFSSTEAAEKNGHPCPKPIGQMMWLVNRVSLPDEVVLDPFMGSGTTGVACMNLGRKFIGIEIEPKYFDIACRRIEQAQAQMRLFA
jgi:site-specific DNA-methyltransferase (adenine-specific)